MNQNKIVEEIEVLKAAFNYLVIKRKVFPYRFSIASGKGIDYKTNVENILSPYKKIGLKPPDIVGSGPDIIAISEKEYWQVECKGTGSGKKQTQRNNFDRALSSVVSYYEDDLFKLDLPEEFRNVSLFLGLALPDSIEYQNELTRRVRQPLRKRLNLWILLYGLDSKTIRPISPDMSINFDT